MPTITTKSAMGEAVSTQKQMLTVDSLYRIDDDMSSTGGAMRSASKNVCYVLRSTRCEWSKNNIYTQKIFM